MRKAVRASVIILTVLMFLMSGANAIALMDEIPNDLGEWVGGNNTPPSSPIEIPIGVRVKVNGKFVVFDVPPYINKQTNRTMVPIRAVAESLDCNVSWNGANKTVHANRDGVNIYLTIDKKFGHVNGKQIALDAPVELISGRTLVPLRFIAENFGAVVKWDGSTRTVDIDYKKGDTGNPS